MDNHIILIISIGLQFIAAFLAFRLILITKKVAAWILLAAAIFLMTLRRGFTLYGWMLAGSTIAPIDIATEIIAFLTSALMVAGLILIGPLFKSIKQSEESFKLGKEKFRLLVSNIPAVVFTGYSDWSVDFFDDKIKGITGYDKYEFDSRKLKWVDIVFEDDVADLKQAMTRALKGDKSYVREYRIKNKEGEIIWIQERSHIVCNNDGEIDYLSGVVFNITDRKMMDQSLQQANADMQALVLEYSQLNQENSILNEMAVALQASLSTEETYPIISQFIQELFPAGSGALYIINHEENLLASASVWGENFTGKQFLAPMDCWAMRQGKVHCLTGSGPQLRCRHLLDSPDTPEIIYLCIPLLAQLELMGMLHLQLSQEKTQPSAGSLEKIEARLQRLALALADLISPAIANLKLRETLRDQAIRDPLTGLFNRRYMMETLVREIHRSDRNQESLGIIMLDLDNFKDFNDTYGHEAGDTLLSAVGKLLQNQIRTADIACRYGGEEFILIMPGAPGEIAEERAEELRRGVQDLQIFFQGQLLGNITISAGVATFPHNGSGAEGLIRAADQAMYAAKKKGRNQVALALGA